MSQTMRYKGYEGSVRYSVEDKLLHGRLLRVKDVVIYDGDSIPSIKKNFRAAVNEYLAFCAAEGKKPNKPLGDVIKLRTSRVLHRRLALFAEEHALTTDAVVNDAVRQYLAQAE